MKLNSPFMSLAKSKNSTIIQRILKMKTKTRSLWNKTVSFLTSARLC